MYRANNPYVNPNKNENKKLKRVHSNQFLKTGPIHENVSTI